jgi:hypothetical protein
MALKNLTLQEMVDVSAAWTNTTDGGQLALLGQPRLAALLPDVQQVHEALLQLKPAIKDPRKAELLARASQQDELHDTLARGIHGVLTQLALLADDGSALLRLRDTLMPAGLGRTIRTTFRSQAGWTTLLRTQLTTEHRQALQSIPLPNGGNLNDTVSAWLDAGDRLGELETERARIEEREQTSPGELAVAARNKWIRVVNALVELGELSELAPDVDQSIFGPLRDAQSKAEQRAARRSTKRVESSP